VQPVEQTDPDGVDFGWVMQTTFVLTIVVGAPVVALLSAGVELTSWSQWASFAVRVGAVVWFLTAVGTYLYARRRERERVRTDDPSEDGTAADGAADPPPEAGDAGVAPNYDPED
jgi:membrane protein YdbS with pleckstrin-like domain